MSWVMRCVGLVGKQLNSTAVPVGMFLTDYDPEAYDGEGDAGWTADLGEAMRFATERDLIGCWQLVPVNRPSRGDGLPNRPLTAYTVTAEQVSD
jgi:hypothetical protein